MRQNSGWWMGAAAVLVLGVVGAVVATSGDDERGAEAPGEGTQGDGDDRPTILRPAARARPSGETEGAPNPAPTPAEVIAEANARREAAEDPDLARLMRNGEAAWSEGFLYGRARRQQEQLTARIERYTANATRLRSEGNEAAADRQMLVVRRMGERLTTVQAEAAAHREAAERDGTLAEESAGYDEAAPSREASPVMVRPPPAAE